MGSINSILRSRASGTLSYIYLIKPTHKKSCSHSVATPFYAGLLRVCLFEAINRGSLYYFSSTNPAYWQAGARMNRVAGNPLERLFLAALQLVDSFHYFGCLLVVFIQFALVQLGFQLFEGLGLGSAFVWEVVLQGTGLH